MGATTLVRRGPITDAFIAFLENQMTLVKGTPLVGDGIRPEGAGWPDQPNIDVFTGYVTVGTGPGQPVYREGPSLGSQHVGWDLTYTLRSVGGARKQADYVADEARAAAVLFAGQTIDTEDGVTWGLVSVIFTQIGALTSDRSFDPPAWMATDSFSIRVSRGRG